MKRRNKIRNDWNFRFIKKFLGYPNGRFCCFGIVVSKLRETKDITRLPIGMKTNYNAEFKNVN